MHLLGDDDPRDKLTKARLWELMDFARRHKVAEVEEGMPASLVRKLLRARGLTDIDIPARRLGQPDRPNGTETPVPASEADVVEIDADDDLMRQWRAQKAVPLDYAEMGMGALRKAAKEAGIKSSNTWKKTDFLKALETAGDESHAA